MATNSNTQRSLNRGINRFCTNRNETPGMELVNASKYVTRHESNNHIIMGAYREEFLGSHPSKMTMGESFRFFFGADIEKEKVQRWAQTLEDLIDGIFPAHDSTHSSARCLIDEYRSTKKIECLFQIYTLHMDFCEALRNDKKKTKAFLEPIIYKLPSISTRFFKGFCYRGLVMEEKELSFYRWALTNKEKFHLETNTFWSTSIDQTVAEYFMDTNDTIRKSQLRVIMKFHFSHECSTAINIFTAPSLSNFEDEQEVLILPGTVFQVISINFYRDKSLYNIHLEYLDMREELNEMRNFVIQSRIDDYIDNLTD